MCKDTGSGIKRSRETGISGERGIRTPGPVTVNGFQDRRIRPLCHLSAAKIRFEIVQPKSFTELFAAVLYLLPPPGLSTQQ